MRRRRELHAKISSSLGAERGLFGRLKTSEEASSLGAADALTSLTFFYTVFFKTSGFLAF